MSDWVHEGKRGVNAHKRGRSDFASIDRLCSSPTGRARTETSSPFPTSTGYDRRYSEADGTSCNRRMRSVQIR